MSQIQPGLEQTRSAVLNVLMAAAVGIAASAIALRFRDHWPAVSTTTQQRRGLMAALFVLAIVSFASRRVFIYQVRFGDPSTRTTRFLRAHVYAALIATLAVPLGLAYGWLVRPQLDAVAPFWVVALALGFLTLPRARDFENIFNEVDS